MLHSMRETIGMNKRAIGIWWRESPGMLVALIFYQNPAVLLCQDKPLLFYNGS